MIKNTTELGFPLDDKQANAITIKVRDIIDKGFDQIDEAQRLLKEKIEILAGEAEEDFNKGEEDQKKGAAKLMQVTILPSLFMRERSLAQKAAKQALNNNKKLRDLMKDD